MYKTCTPPPQKFDGILALHDEPEFWLRSNSAFLVAAAMLHVQPLNIPKEFARRIVLHIVLENRDTVGRCSRLLSLNLACTVVQMFI